MKISMAKQMVFLVSAFVFSAAIPVLASSAEDLKLGMTAYGQKRYSEAAAYFEKCLSGSKADVRATYYLALSSYQIAKPARAKQLFEYIIKYFPQSAEAKLSRPALDRLSGGSKVSSTDPVSPSTGDDVPTELAGKYKDKRILLSDEEYKKEYAAIARETNLVLGYGVRAGEHALSGSINGQHFQFRLNKNWETLISLADWTHARNEAPKGEPDATEKNEFSDENVPVWRSSAEVTIGPIKRKVPISIAKTNIGAPRLGRAFFEDLVTEGVSTNTITVRKKTDSVAQGKKSQIAEYKGEYDSLPESAEIRFSPGEQGHMVVDAYINGKLQRCMFDTGANEFFGADQIRAAGITLPAKPDGAAAGWAGKAIPTWKVTVPIRVGTITRRLEVAVAQQGVSMPLIGQGFIRDYQYSIDRAAGRMTLHKKTSKAFKEKSQERNSVYDVPCTIENDREYVDLNIGEQRFGGTKVLVDTGASTTIISAMQAKAAGIVIPPQAPYFSIQGVGGDLEVRQVHVDLRLGPIVRHDFPVMVGGMHGSAIGQDFMSGWRFTVDRERGLLRFFH